MTLEVKMTQGVQPYRADGLADAHRSERLIFVNIRKRIKVKGICVGFLQRNDLATEAQIRLAL